MRSIRHNRNTPSREQTIREIGAFAIRVFGLAFRWIGMSSVIRSPRGAYVFMKISKIVAITGVLSVGVLLFPKANATQTKKVINGREVVVHTNPVPVVLHRLVPPQHGRHVTQREVEKGRLPKARSQSTSTPRRRP